MLRQVREQSGQVAARYEFIFCYNPEQVDEASIRKAIDSNLRGPGLDPRAVVRVEPVVGKHYYELKNHAATLARGDVLLCIDSDVIPEPGWMKSLLGHAIEHPECPIVCGSTYIDPEGLIGKAFAVGWFYPMRDGATDVSAGHSHFWANNVAFRRRFFLDNPYPTLTGGATRNACRHLADRARAAGTSIVRVAHARVAHPAPNGTRHVLVRGLAEGRDTAAYWKDNGWSAARRLRKAPGLGLGRFKRACRNIARHGRSVGIRAWEVPAVLGIIAVYDALMIPGAMLHVLAPRLASRLWRI